MSISSVNNALTADLYAGRTKKTAAGKTNYSSRLESAEQEAGKTGAAQKASQKPEAQEMAEFKKEFYAELERIPIHPSLVNVAVNISEEAFQNMKDDPAYREQMLAVIRRDLTGSYMPSTGCSLVLTVGAEAKDYRGDSWSADYDDAFDARSQNSFYKKTRRKKDRQKELLEEFLKKRALMKKQRQQALQEKTARREAAYTEALQLLPVPKVQTDLAAGKGL